MDDYRHTATDTQPQTPLTHGCRADNDDRPEVGRLAVVSKASGLEWRNES